MNLDDVAHEYHVQLLDSGEGQKYFEDFEIDLAMIKEFQLGWIDAPVLSEHNPLLNKPVFPYVAVGGKIKQLRHSAFEFDAAREFDQGVFGRNMPTDPFGESIYNVRHAVPGLRTSRVVVVTDVLSVIHARSRGLRSVAVPGYTLFQEAWFELFRSADVWIVTNDHDDVAIVKEFKERKIQHTHLHLPRGQILAHNMDRLEIE